MISDQALKEFKAIWEEEFGEVLPDEIALEEAIPVLIAVNQTYRPIKKDWVKEENEKDNEPIT